MVSNVLDATMMCCVATCTSRKRRCNVGGVVHRMLPPASVYIASTTTHGGLHGICGRETHVAPFSSSRNRLAAQRFAWSQAASIAS